DSSYDKEVKDIHNSILFHQPVSMARCWGQMYEKKSRESYATHGILWLFNRKYLEPGMLIV
ncbi:MAG: hypothetical protein MR548_06775, partial [Prevotella sp.]|nr:hypothetical protein [Prevotella sp.]